MRMYSVRFGFSYLKDRKAILWLCVTIFYFQKKKRERELKKEKSSLFVLLLVHKHKKKILKVLFIEAS